MKPRLLFARYGSFRPPPEKRLGLWAGRGSSAVLPGAETVEKPITHPFDIAPKPAKPRPERTTTGPTQFDYLEPPKARHQVPGPEADGTPASMPQRAGLAAPHPRYNGSRYCCFGSYVGWYFRWLPRLARPIPESRSLNKQREILAHAEKLRADSQNLKPRWSGKGLWADFNITLTAAELEENQREMWRNFPLDDL